MNAQRRGPRSAGARKAAAWLPLRAAATPSSRARTPRMFWRLAGALAYLTAHLALALETLTDWLLAHARRGQRRARRA